MASEKTPLIGQQKLPVRRDRPDVKACDYCASHTFFFVERTSEVDGDALHFWESEADRRFDTAYFMAYTSMVSEKEKIFEKDVYPRRNTP
jgi:hypothetical protein